MQDVLATYPLLENNLNLLKPDIVMTDANKLDKQINDYLIQLSGKQKKALKVINHFAEKQEYDVWQDAAFIEELDQRTADYESGKAKVLTLDELESNVRKAYKAK